VSHDGLGDLRVNAGGGEPTSGCVARAVDVAVVAESPDLNGIAPTSVYVDNLGHNAAKFAVADLKREPGEATLTLSGGFEGGGGFSASDRVTVK